jgi:guanosine-3',5'-bis(diphosphate) 3'-pyrophosphohydrolase
MRKIILMMLLAVVSNSAMADWDMNRKQEYFNWAKAVVDQIRGTNADLEGIFDAIYAKGY